MGMPKETSSLEIYIRAIQDMYRDFKTCVLAPVGATYSFEVKVGLHQGSDLSPYLFVIVMDVLCSPISRGPPWNMLFANDIVLCGLSCQELNEDLESWRRVLEDSSFKISRKKLSKWGQVVSPYKECSWKNKSFLNTWAPLLPLRTTWMLRLLQEFRVGGQSGEVRRGVLCDSKVPLPLKGGV